VNRLDRQVQEILDVLAKRGFTVDNTLIIFAGDNGLAFPHGKGALHDPGLNVPLVVRWTGTVRAGTESRELISGEDLAPTLLEIAGVKVPERITGQSFAALLRGESHTPRKYIFAERGPHGSAPITVNMRNSGFDLSRGVRSDRYKFIYNCTPWIPYAPVDSANEDAWRDMVAANEAGNLAPELKLAYFTAPRPVYELYDLERDPSELNNLSGNRELATIERELRSALTEKMITDFDYVPLPAPLANGDDAPLPPKTKKGKKGRKE
jgi:arylsulfatase A-like enzyme